MIILHFAFSESTRSVAVEMLDRRLVPPGDLVDRHAQRGGDFLPLRGAWRPAAEDNRQRATFLQPTALGKLVDVDLLIAAKVGDGLRHGITAGEQEVRLRHEKHHAATYRSIYQRVAPCRLVESEKVWQRF